LLAADRERPSAVSDLVARSVADEVVLVTYVVKQATDAEERSFRSSLWLKVDDQWTLLFHQGTPVRPAHPDG
jgi:hypothetical protein